MRTTHRIAAATAAVTVVLIIAWSTWRYHCYSPADPPTQVHPPSVAYFRDSYESSRSAFRDMAQARRGTFADVDVTHIPVASKTEHDLTIDVLYIPAQDSKERLLVFSSGVHGVEGFAGSAVQRMVLDEFVTDRLVATTGVLMLHAVNPYGFKRKRRVTENNVDLNRNCDSDHSLFETPNPGYRAVRELINPAEPVATRSAANLFFHLRTLMRIAQTSLGELRQAVVQGQYEFDRGVFFGGRDFEPQLEPIARTAGRVLNEYPVVLAVDIHTGYGERGTLHLFPNPVEDASVRSLTERLFEGHTINWGGEGDFYTVSGDYSGFLGKLMTNGTYLAMTFEYGTLNSQTLTGSIKSLHNMVLENQGVHHGYASPADEARVKREFEEMFDPSSPAWRTKIMQDTRKVLEPALARFEEL